jgi:hypothetical protein
VPWASFHSLRYTCATVLFRHGANAVQVQRWLGHHSAEFTLSTCAHLLPDDLPDAAYLDDVLEGHHGDTSTHETRRTDSDAPHTGIVFSAGKT